GRFKLEPSPVAGGAANFRRPIAFVADHPQGPVAFLARRLIVGVVESNKSLAVEAFVVFPAVQLVLAQKGQGGVPTRAAADFAFVVAAAAGAGPPPVAAAAVDPLSEPQVEISAAQSERGQIPFDFEIPRVRNPRRTLGVPGAQQIPPIFWTQNRAIFRVGVNL